MIIIKVIRLFQLFIYVPKKQPLLQTILLNTYPTTTRVYIPPTMHKYDTCIGYDTYPICQYVYFQNNKIWYVIYKYWKMYNNFL